MPGRAVYTSTRTVARALDLDPAHRGALELTLEVVADLPVLDELSRYSASSANHRDFQSVVMPSGTRRG
jgi:hypothetical protein